MAVTIIKGIVRYKGKSFVKGDIIEGLDKKEEARLISLGVAQQVKEIPVDKK